MNPFLPKESFWINLKDGLRYKVLMVDADGVVASHLKLSEIHNPDDSWTWFSPVDEFFKCFKPVPPASQSELINK
jgi:hypothetical protein